MTHTLSIAWRILINLVTGAVIVAMFHAASSRFETIVVSGLVLIYVSVISSYMALGYALSRKWNIDLARYITLAKTLGVNTEIEEEARKENEADEQKGQTPFGITGAFNVLFSLIAIGYLIHAIT